MVYYFQILPLNKKIDEQQYEIGKLNEKVEFIQNYYNKYYYNSQIVISNTFFGEEL